MWFWKRSRSITTRLFIISWLSWHQTVTLVPNHAGPTGRRSKWVRFNYKGLALCHTNEARLYIDQLGGNSRVNTVAYSQLGERRIQSYTTFTIWNRMNLQKCFLLLLVCTLIVIFFFQRKSGIIFKWTWKYWLNKKCGVSFNRPDGLNHQDAAKYL